MSALVKLRKAIRALGDGRRLALEREAGVPFRVICNASGATAVNAEAYLALCCALGIDPVDGYDCKPNPRPIDIDWAMLGRDVKAKRTCGIAMTLREAGSDAGVSHTTIFRAETGQVLSAAAMLALCQWVSTHPVVYTRPRSDNRLPHVGKLSAGRSAVSRDSHCSKPGRAA